MRLIIIFSLFVLPLASLLPVRKEDDTAELCPGDYCSMFEGICKNGGTCISKGCKGVCKCTKEYTGHNCDTPNTPNTPVTTKAPKPKEEKQEDRSREKDFSTILSLFRMLSVPRTRPKVSNHMDKAQEKKGKEIISKSKQTKETDKDSVTNNGRQRENFPPRQEQTHEKKQEEVASNNEKKQNKIGENIRGKDDQPRTKLSESVSNSDKQSLSVSTVIQTTSPSPLSSKKPAFISTTTPHPVAINKGSIVQTDTQIPRTMRLKSIRSDSHRRIQNIIATTKEPVVIETTTIGMTSTVSVSPNSNPIVFSGKTGHFVQNVFRPSPSSLQVATKSTVIPKNEQDGTKISYPNENTKIISPQPNIAETSVDVAKAFAQMANAGPKVLSSATLSNLYLTHTLFSKSRMFVSSPSQIRGISTKQPLYKNVTVTSKQDATEKDDGNSSSVIELLQSTSSLPSETITASKTKTINSEKINNEPSLFSPLQSTSLKPTPDTEGDDSPINPSDASTLPRDISSHSRASNYDLNEMSKTETTTKSTLHDTISSKSSVSNKFKNNGKSRTVSSPKP